MEPRIFKRLNTNQRMSIINLLSTIGLSDGPINNQESEIISKIGDLCGVLVDKCVDYFEYNGGQSQLTNDLKMLSNGQKEILIVIVWELIVCDEKPNEKELSVAFAILESLDISENMFFKTIEKKSEIMKNFGQS